jgi:hypothetical protein
MQYGSTSAAGRHRASAAEAPPTPRQRARARRSSEPESPAPRGSGRTSARRTSKAAIRAERKQHLIAAASIASIALVSSFVLALPANAAEPFASAPPGSAAVVNGQTLDIASGAQNPTVQRSSYGQISTSVGEVAVTPGGLTNDDWAALVLTDGGWPLSSNNVTVILQWMDSENGPPSWYLRNNPLNNGYGSGGGAGFGSYPNLIVAAQDVAVNLQRNSGYAGIVNNLAASSPVGTTVQAIEDSPWAGSHYGYGTLWHAVDVPTVSAPASDW